MAQGIKLPVTVVEGRLELLSGDAYINQLVMTALMDGDSDNPFEHTGLGETMIFGINDAMTEGELKAKVKQIFENLEGDQLARLEKLDFEREGQEMFMYVTYTNLETGYRVEGVEVYVPAAAGV